MRSLLAVPATDFEDDDSSAGRSDQPHPRYACTVANGCRCLNSTLASHASFSSVAPTMPYSCCLSTVTRHAVPSVSVPETRYRYHLDYASNSSCSGERPYGVGQRSGRHDLTYECCLCAFREDLQLQFLASFDQRPLRS